MIKKLLQVALGFFSFFCCGFDYKKEARDIQISLSPVLLIQKHI